MGYGSGKLDMTHTFTSYLVCRYFDAALFADLALVACAAFIFSAVALPVLRRSENALAEQSLAFGFEGSVIDGFGLLHLAIGPFSYLLGRRKSDLYGFKLYICIVHNILPFLSN